MHNSKPAQDYILSRGLSYQLTDVGYNSGQFHHGTRKDEQLISQAVQYGLLLDQDKKGRTGESAYKAFGKSCIVFPLKDKSNNVASLYFRSIIDNKDSRHYYLRDRQGIYPNYPHTNTTKLILTESIIDAATLLEQETIKNNYTVLALYGTNGLTDEHKQAINQLINLEEIIFALDNDLAGKTAQDKYAQLFTEQYPHIQLSTLALPCKDINETLLAHNPEILQHLIDTRTTSPTPPKEGLPDGQQNTSTLFSTETIRSETTTELSEETEIHSPTSPLFRRGLGEVALDTSNPSNLKYPSDTVLYQIKGFKVEQLDSLKVTLQITVV